MASYHLSVKTIKRSAGRSVTAAAAYRAGCEIVCEREGRVHDYTRKFGVEAAFILAPEDAPDWAQDRAALWNAAEARETRANSVTAREWELALPAECVWRAPERTTPREVGERLGRTTAEAGRGRLGTQLAVFALVNVACIVLRRREPDEGF